MAFMRLCGNGRLVLIFDELHHNPLLLSQCSRKSEQTRRLNCHGKVSEYRPDAFVLVNKSGVKMTAPRSLGDES